MKYFCLNNISKNALNALKEPNFVTENVNEADAIILRSFEMKDYELPASVLAIGRAGAGVNNIPHDKYASQGVVVFNTPGANANAVKELVLCGLFLSCRDIIGANIWVNENKDDENIAKTAEKVKNKYGGYEIYGKTICVVGLGVIGSMVANACVDLGMKVVGYDPFLSVEHAMKLSRDVKYEKELEKAVSQADFVSIHVPLSPATKGMIGKGVLDAFKDGATLLNFSRDALVDDTALLDAMNAGKVKKYVTDFANPAVVKLPNTICLPHLGASTEEAEENCANMAISQLVDYLENGNIKNSVNYPAVDAGYKHDNYRICIAHKNVPGIIASFSAVIGACGSNIATMVNKSKNDYAYTVLDVDKKVDMQKLEALDGVLKVRVI